MPISCNMVMDVHTQGRTCTRSAVCASASRSDRVRMACRSARSEAACALAADARVPNNSSCRAATFCGSTTSVQGLSVFVSGPNTATELLLWPLLHNGMTPVLCLLNALHVY